MKNKNTLRKRVLSILFGLLLLTSITTVVKADVFSQFGIGFPWQHNSSWGNNPSANSMLKIFSNWGCYNDSNTFCVHFQRNGNYLPNVPILAISDGYYAGLSYWNGNYGNCVSIDHANDNISVVCHITSSATNPRAGGRTWAVGDQVKKGDTIGYIYSDSSQIRSITWMSYSRSRNKYVNPSDSGYIEGQWATWQQATSWSGSSIGNIYNVTNYAPVKSLQTGPRGGMAWEPQNNLYTPIQGGVRTYGYFLPQGYNADIIAEANQNLSYIPHDVSSENINTATGFYSESVVDTEYKSMGGVPFEFRRSYESDNTFVGMLGVGWRTSFETRMYPNNIYNNAVWTILFPDGHGESFQESDNNYALLDYTFSPLNPESKGTLTRGSANENYNLVYTDNSTGTKMIFRGDAGSGNLYGKLIEIKYPNTLIRLSYSADGINLTNVSDINNGRSYTFTYDSSNKLQTIQDLVGNVVTYTYNYDNRIETIKNALGSISKYEYNVNGKISKLIDANNIAVKTITYDSNGKVTSIKDGNNNTKSYAYSTDALGKLTTITDPQGNITKHWHNNNNYLIQVQHPNNDLIKYEYDSKGNRTKETTPDGKIYLFTYDSLGNRTSSTFPDGSKIETAYNASGKPTQIKETPATGYGDQRIKYFNYDSAQNISLYQAADGTRNYYAYNENNQLSVETDNASSPSGLSIEFGTDTGWSNSRHVRMLADVNGDGKDDMVGFADEGVRVALANGNKIGNAFDNATLWFAGFGYVNGGWRVDAHPRLMADVNGDGKKDIVGFGNAGVSVALSTGTSFGTASLWAADFGANQGWKVDPHVRGAADFNGDGKADIIGINDNQTFVAISTGTSFNPKQTWLATPHFSSAGTWNVNSHPRLFGDVNGDKKADIVGIGSWTVEVALSNGNGFNAPGTWRKGFGDVVGWQIGRHPRALIDVNNDGKSDIVGFAETEVVVAYSNGSKFSDIPQTIDIALTAARGYTSPDALRLAGDFNGDKKTDILAIGGTIWGQTLEGQVKLKAYDQNGYLSLEKVAEAGVDTQNVPTPNESPTKDSETVSSYHFDNLNDSSINGNTLSQTGSVKNIDSKFSGEMKFEGTGYLTSPLNGLNSSSNFITISFWANVKSQNGNSTSVLTAYPDDGANRLNIHFPWSNNIIYWDYGNISTGGRLSTNFDTSWFNVWSYWTFTSDPSGMKIYRNGRLIASNTSYSTFNRGTKRLYIGSYNGTNNWNGDLDEFKMLNRSLTQSEIENEYNKYQYYALQGATTEYKNDKLGNVLSQKDANGNTTTYTYNALNQILTLTDARGNTKSFEYDKLGRVTKETDETGVLKTNTYDNNGNITKIQVGDSKITQYVYDKNNNKIKEIDPQGNYTVITYDSINRPTKQENFDKDNNLLSTTSQTYNSSGLKATETDGNGVVTTYTYDNLNHIKTVTTGVITKNFKYDFWGNVLTETDWEGRTYEYTYDKLGRLLTTKNPLEKLGNGLGTTNKYDKAGNVIEIKDTMGNTTKQFFDNKNNLIKVINAAGKTATYEYDKLKT